MEKLIRKSIIKGHSFDYEIHEDGRFYSQGRNKFMKLKSGKIGYKTINIRLKGHSNYKTLYIHRLLAKAFIENPHGYKVVNHKNGIKHDNRLSNLEWCTQSQNYYHAIDVGLMNNRGQNHGNAKWSDADISDIRNLFKTKQKSKKELCHEYNMSQPYLHRILNNKRRNK